MLGGSLGKAILKRNENQSVIGIDVDKTNLETALRVGAISSAMDFQTGVSQADLIVLATPLGIMPKLIIDSAQLNTRHALITDLGSVKSPLVKQFERDKLPNGCRYVGSHPMAGKEVSGAQFSDADLFVDNTVVITPSENQINSPDVETLIQFWKSVSAKPIVLSAVEHDEIVSQTSHLPHVISVALMNTIQAQNGILTGTGFQSVSRLASGSIAVWRDILRENKENVVHQIDMYIESLTRIKFALENDSESELSALLQQAHDKKRQISRS